jgi:hypothetical protein
MTSVYEMALPHSMLENTAKYSSGQCFLNLPQIHHLPIKAIQPTDRFDFCPAKDVRFGNSAYVDLCNTRLHEY